MDSAGLLLNAALDRHHLLVFSYVTALGKIVKAAALGSFQKIHAEALWSNSMQIFLLQIQISHITASTWGHSAHLLIPPFCVGKRRSFVICPSSKINTFCPRFLPLTNSEPRSKDEYRISALGCITMQAKTIARTNVLTFASHDSSGLQCGL